MIATISKNEIINKLQELNSIYEKEGFFIVGLFGSYAKDEQDEFSDIDIAYKIDYDKFSKKYKDGFSKLLRIEDIKKELEKKFGKAVDLVPFNKEKAFKGLVNV
jgi:predicted nucleotidyltransferase